ncbi:PREDICTED: 39S ribosomal protein L39, mitochondrial isoform X1 [Trachymyrmex septentrionalis]|uniref:39S ribosomal protein L39, mitochondrial isoform X1 n=1 Tax=Trachymyrmex septentrionalis TaxID=34720 RepID=UPI00084F4E56|nr:PREDICTED: 39S ribosomal protein L39, mitochondrial isoform X1 [Trachymyrmex septentrionalis]
MLHGCKRFCASGLKLPAQIMSSRYAGTLSKAEARKRRSQLFDEEKRRQRSELGRIEKIEVKYKSAEEEIVMAMNRNISTPYDCARHISESVAKMSAIALVDNQTWDMHRPFTDDCELQLITMRSPQIRMVNYAFWRTCSLILGAVADSAFKDNINLHLHSFPIPNITSGSFTYDVFIDLPDWQPTNSELYAMSALFVKLNNRELLLERLEVPSSIALDMFQDNPFKSQQIPNIVKNSNNDRVTLYRIGDHVDISKGPMVGNSGLVGRVTVSAIHRLTDGFTDGLYRFQGVALPKGILLNHFAYGILEKRAKKLNITTWQPHRVEEEAVSITASVN